MREERKVSWTMRMRTPRIRGVDAWNLVRGMALGLACALLATGCATAVAYRAPVAGPQTTCVTPAPERDLVVGVALSGGGSRAALFGASGLEALAQVRGPDGASVLDQVSYLSSVSGGSLSASYYALNKPPRETADSGAGRGTDGRLQDLLCRIQGQGESRFRKRASLAPDREFSLDPQPCLGGPVTDRTVY